jgi:CRISPR-associated protein Csm1
MDVDSLGRLFSEQNDWARTAKLSQALKTFFEERIFDLWKSDFTFHDQTGNEQRTPFSENIYVVFSGGDDCMMVGGWDAVFAFAGKIKEAFDDFWKDKMGELGLKKPPTLSASLTVVDPKFPIVRLAALAEEALKEAKQAAQGEKNRIAVFGRILTWDEFFKAQRIAHQLERLIKKENEPRNILQRIRMSQSSFDPILRKALEEGVVENPAIWRIRYYLRRSKNDVEDIVKEYTEAILQAVLCRKRTNSDLFPVAARWAEFMTRSHD